MATTAERLAALESAVFGAVPTEDPPPYVEPVAATVIDGDKVITATSGTKADLVALVAAKSAPAGKE